MMWPCLPNPARVAVGLAVPVAALGDLVAGLVAPVGRAAHLPEVLAGPADPAALAGLVLPPNPSHQNKLA